MRYMRSSLADLLRPEAAVPLGYIALLLLAAVAYRIEGVARHLTLPYPSALALGISLLAILVLIPSVRIGRRLELRDCGEVLEAELGRMYDVVGQRTTMLLFSPYKRLARELMQTLFELSEFIERVENSLKIVGDVYLARVYEAAIKQLRVARWTEQVTRKHRLLQQAYGLLKGETDTSRALTLETMVVVLILFEILMALFRVSGH